MQRCGKCNEGQTWISRRVIIHEYNQFQQSIPTIHKVN